MRKFLFALLAAPLLFGACSDDNDESTPTLSFAKPVLALSTGSVTLDLQVSGVDLSSLASPVTVPVAFSGTAGRGFEGFGSGCQGFRVFRIGRTIHIGR